MTDPARHDTNQTDALLRHLHLETHRMTHLLSKFQRSVPAVSAMVVLALGTSAFAQHSGDIEVRVVDDRLDAFGPIGDPDPGRVFYGVFGDTGFPGYTSNPGFDAFSGTLGPGRIGFDVLEGLRRWDPVLGEWESAIEVPESLSISFITLGVVVEDEPVEGFDLAVQPDGGWHRHLDFELLGQPGVARRSGIYRLDLSLYSTMGLADSEPFTIAFNYEASQSEADAALASLEPASDCPGDLDGDGTVNGADFGLLLAAFNTSDPAADLDGDGDVGGADIGVLLAAWGPCP